MKKVLAFSILSTVGCIIALTISQCSNDQPYQQSYQQPPVQDYGDYQVVNNPSGQQVVIVKNDDGSEFFMEYLMWQSIFNSSGIYGCRNYYQQHYYDSGWSTQQNNYRTSTTSVVNNYYGGSVDASKPLSEQIKYKQSNGFGKGKSPVQTNSGGNTTTTPTTTSTQGSTQTNTGTKSSGFSQKWYSPNTTTATPKPSYSPSSGFGKSSSPSSTYKPSSGFGSSSSSSSYKPSSGFGSKSSSSSSSSSSYKSSSGFGKKKN